MVARTGILGIGVHLPPQVRTNDWWPDAIVDAWRERTRDRAGQAPPEPTFPGQEFVYEAMARFADDPFRGAKERRVLAADARAADMEVAAAEDLFGRLDVDRSEIDLLLNQSSFPDYLETNLASTVQHRLGLPGSMVAVCLGSACNGFQHQMTLADAMIRSGQARYALLIQSCATSRVSVQADPSSAWFGDGATAVLVGPVREGGLLGAAHRSDGRLQGGLVCGVPGAEWWEDGSVVAYRKYPERTLEMLMRLPEYARDVIHGALDDAGLQPSDVDFYAAHQAFAWYREVTQRFAGLDRARSVDTFTWAGSLSAANLPLVLSVAQRDGLLNPGDLVVTQAGGSGITWSSLVLRWSPEAGGQ